MPEYRCALSDAQGPDGSFALPAVPFALTVWPRETARMRVEWTSYSVKWAVRLRAAVPELHIGQGTCPQTTGWLDEYFAGSPRPFPYPEHLRRWFDLSPAQVAVFKTLRKIPLGETRSYDDVARATGLHPRQIGWLVSANHLAILIPCHRVVGKDGGLVGYGGGLTRKRWLLDHELRAAGVVLR
jgi:O-6-methylguanine DNA methyltransferase